MPNQFHILYIFLFYNKTNHKSLPSIPISLITVSYQQIHFLIANIVSHQYHYKTVLLAANITIWTFKRNKEKGSTILTISDWHRQIMPTFGQGNIPHTSRLCHEYSSTHTSVSWTILPHLPLVDTPDKF